MLRVSEIKEPFFQMETVNLLLLMKSHLIIFLDAISSSNKRKEKQKLISIGFFVTMINSLNIDIKMINAPKLKW